MILYSHVSLLLCCKTAADAAWVTTQLDVEPTRVREDKISTWSEETGHSEKSSFTWMLDSPKGHADGDPTARLYALAEVIGLFAERLSTVRPLLDPWVDIIYHVTPNYPDRITGEFDWFRIPAEIMRRYGAWDLSISYEMFWFEHPDKKLNAQRGWLTRLIRRARGAKPA